MGRRGFRLLRGWAPPVALLLWMQVQGCSVLAPMLPPLDGAPPAPLPRPRERLIGLEGEALSRCIGPPLSVDSDADGETERLTYRFYDFPEEDVGRPGPARIPDSLRDGIDRTGRPRPGVALCEIVFELKDGLVREFDVVGIRADGLANPGCVDQKTRRCRLKRAPQAESKQTPLR